MARGRNEKPENAGIEKQPRNGQVRVESEVSWDDSKAFGQIGYPQGHKSSRYIGKTIKSKKIKKNPEKITSAQNQIGSFGASWVHLGHSRSEHEV